MSDTATVQAPDAGLPSAQATDARPAATGADAPRAANAGFPFEQLEPSPPLPRDSAERLLAQASVQAEQIRAQAREDGYAEGRAQGHADGLEQSTAATLALGEALRELHELRAQMSAELEQDAIELSLALAAKILVGTFEAQPQRIVEVVRGALRRVVDRRRIVVLVNPEDLDVLSGAVQELQAQAGGIELCDVQADRRVGRGGAVVRTSEGEIDATVETQLARAREVMLEALTETQSSS